MAASEEWKIAQIRIPVASHTRAPFGNATACAGRIPSAHCNAEAKQFVWTAPAADILEKVARGRQVLESPH
jgi:hypothetical protein